MWKKTIFDIIIILYLPNFATFKIKSNIEYILNSTTFYIIPKDFYKIIKAMNVNNDTVLY